MQTFIAICSGIAALYVLVEAGTVIYILRNKATAIPRIRRSLRYLFGLDDDAYNLNASVRDARYEVQRVNERIVNATVDNSAFKGQVADEVVGKLLQLRNKKVGGKTRQLTNRR